MESHDLANNLVAGGAALAGLVLVFLGNTISAYESYSAQDRPAVRGKYRLRAWLGFCALLFSLIGSGAALVSVSTPIVASVFLGFAVLLLLAIALMAAWEI